MLQYVTIRSLVIKKSISNLVMQLRPDICNQVFGKRVASLHKGYHPSLLANNPVAFCSEVSNYEIFSHKLLCLLYDESMFKNIDKRRLVSFLSFLLKHFYAFESLFYSCKNINFPKQKPVIFALWHAHQCGLYANEDRGNLNVMISKSNDGDIIAAATEHVGIKVVRGSSKRSGAAASLALLEKLEQGECAAITIDGPRGPFGVVKDGIINIAKLSQVPIVPMIWYSPSKWLLEFNTWDKFRFPILGVKTIAVYGEPIYIKSDCTPEEAEEYRLTVENKLKELYQYAQDNFDELIKS